MQPMQVYVCVLQYYTHCYVYFAHCVTIIGIACYSMRLQRRAAGELLDIFSLPFLLPWTDRQMEKGTS